MLKKKKGAGSAKRVTRKTSVEDLETKADPKGGRIFTKHPAKVTVPDLK